MNITIQIKRRDVYGIKKIYICNEQQAKIITQLTGKKTIDDKDIQALRLLGINIDDLDERIERIINGKG